MTIHFPSAVISPVTRPLQSTYQCSISEENQVTPTSTHASEDSQEMREMREFFSGLIARTREKEKEKGTIPISISMLMAAMMSIG